MGDKCGKQYSAAIDQRMGCQLAVTRNGCWQTPHSMVSEPELGTWTCNKSNSKSDF